MKYRECAGCRFLEEGRICEFCKEAEFYEPEDFEPLEFDDEQFSYDPTLDPEKYL